MSDNYFDEQSEGQILSYFFLKTIINPALFLYLRGKMKKEETALLGQLLSSMQEAVTKLEEAFERKDGEGITRAKREILDLQKKIDSII